MSAREASLKSTQEAVAAQQGAAQVSRQAGGPQHSYWSGFKDDNSTAWCNRLMRQKAVTGQVDMPGRSASVFACTETTAAILMHRCCP